MNTKHIKSAKFLLLALEDYSLSKLQLLRNNYECKYLFTRSISSIESDILKSWRRKEIPVRECKSLITMTKRLSRKFRKCFTSISNENDEDAILQIRNDYFSILNRYKDIASRHNQVRTTFVIL